MENIKQIFIVKDDKQKKDEFKFIQLDFTTIKTIL
jgi:hypothetical protein